MNTHDSFLAGDTRRAASAVEVAVRRSIIEGRHAIIAYLMRSIGREDAEDVFQRFVVRALERGRDLRDIRSLRFWLGRVLTSTVADHMRRKRRDRNREWQATDEEIANVPATDGSAVPAVCACLYRVLLTLPPGYATIVRRVDLLGEPRERIAASLGITPGNADVRLHRARRALRRRLEETCLTCPLAGFLDCQCEDAERIRQMRHAERATVRFDRPRRLIKQEGKENIQEPR